MLFFEKESLKATLWSDFKGLGQLMTVYMFQIFFKQNQHRQRIFNNLHAPQITAPGQRRLNKNNLVIIPASGELMVE